MKIKNWFILAGGSATRWQGYQGEKNKCFVKIDGERLIDRTERLLKENGITNIEIVLEGYNSKREAFEGIARKSKGAFGILLGDCYYTEAIIKDAVNRDVKSWKHYYCPHGNPWTGCPWEEGYIHLVPQRKWWLDKMTEFNKKCDSGEIEFKKDYQIDRYLRGLGQDDYRPNELDEHDIYWCDETDDLDYPNDYDMFMARHEANKRGERQDKLSIIIPNWNNGKHIGRLLENLTSQRVNVDRQVEIIVVDDGSTDNSREVIEKFGLVRHIYQPNRGVSNARNVGLMASTGKYITFIDSDDNVESGYIRTVFSEMDRGYDYCVFPWIDDKSGDTKFLFFDLVGNAAVWAYAFTWDTIGNERFREDWTVAEDLDWLQRVIVPGKNRGLSDKPIYHYDWNANPDSLYKRFNRGDIKKER
jgi:hypothetical protein